MLRHSARQPLFWSVTVSVGFHGLMWVLLPAFQSANADAANIPDPVNVIELTPSETARLPDFSIPTLNPPDLLDNSDFYTFSNPTPISPDWRSSSIPRPFYIPPSPYQPYGYTSPTYNGPSNQNPPPQESEETSEDTTTPTPSEETESDFDVSQVETRRLDLLDELALSSGSENAEGESGESSDSGLLTYNTEGTTTISEAISAWMDENPDARDNSADSDGNYPFLRNVQLVKLPYPPEACSLLNEPEIETIANLAYGIVLTPDEALAKDPQLLQSSGYGIFNQIGFNALKDYPFSDDPNFENNTEGNKLYLVAIEFELVADVCAPPPEDESTDASSAEDGQAPSAEPPATDEPAPDPFNDGE
jgi:hypothetical protein